MVTLGCCLLFLTLIGIVLGILGAVKAGKVIGDADDDKAEMQSADIIVAAYDEWTKPLATELTAVGADEACPEGWAPFFTKEW